VLCGWGLIDPGFLDRSELIIVEIVANAVRHAGGCPWLELATDADRRWVTVAAIDSNSHHPTFKAADGDSGGRGLLIVAALSTAYGSHPRPGGKRVWARLRAHGPCTVQDWS
jgi:hypothetical protein